MFNLNFRVKRVRNTVNTVPGYSSPTEGTRGKFESEFSGALCGWGIGSETIVLIPERLGNDVSKSDRVQEWSYTFIISYSGAVKQLI